MKYIIAIIILSVFQFGCKDDPASIDNIIPPPPIVKAVYVLNEGNFGDAAGARLSVYDVTNDTVYKDVIESANTGLHLGSTGDDIKSYNGKLYIAMSGSENISAVRISDFHVLQSVALPGSSPHDIVIDTVRHKLFVTRLYKNSVFVLDLSSLAILDSIAVGSNPQGMALVGNQLYVCNSGYGADSTVSVIDAVADTVKKTIRVGSGPTGITVGNSGNLIVSCTGNAFGVPATTGRLAFISSSSNILTDSILFAENLWGSISTGSDGNAYFIGVTSGDFYGGPIHKVNLSTKTVTMNFIAGTYYGLTIDENYNELYAADAKQFASDGEVKIYKNDGTLKKSFVAQKGPGAIVLSH